MPDAPRRGPLPSQVPLLLLREIQRPHRRLHHPHPSKGFTKIKFLTGPFTKLTDRLSAFLKPAPVALDDPEFFRISTTLIFHVIVESIAQAGSEDAIGRFSASNIADGTVKLAIHDGPAAALCCRDHHSTAVHRAPQNPLSYTEFHRICAWLGRCLTAR